MKILQPIKSMLAEYAEGEQVFDEIIRLHNGRTAAELKYDGYRIQLHKKGNNVKAFTRNMNEAPLGIYPELSSSISKLPDCVLDCELNGGIGHKGFQAVQNRFRLKEPRLFEEYKQKADLARKLELRVFDTLNFDGEWLTEETYDERRKYTEKIDERRIKPTQAWRVDSAESLEKLFCSVISEDNEGLVCKSTDSLYIPGYRGNHWIKIKKFETLDLLLLGVYIKNCQISQFLCGTYNDEKDCYETLGKVNAKREGLGKAAKLLINEKMTKKRSAKISLSPKMKSDEMPDFYIEPKDSIVLEIKAMNILLGKNSYSCGLEDEKAYSLRIGWVKGIRHDKKHTDVTTTSQIESLYKGGS